MDKLLGHRKAGRGNGNEFLVRWAGKDAATDPPTPWSDSYEPESGVADDLIDSSTPISLGWTQSSPNG